jgi:hypothetical protein
MIRRRLITTFLSASLVVVGSVAMTGCANEEGQPSRGSISAPRKGGGVQDTAGEPFKGKSAIGGGAAKPGGKAD